MLYPGADSVNPFFPRGLLASRNHATGRHPRWLTFLGGELYRLFKLRLAVL